MTSPMARVTAMAAGLAVAAAAYAQDGSPRMLQRIGKEALIELPKAALWSRQVNFRPGDGEVVSQNPPCFSWLYADDESGGTRDTNLKLFQFQVAYDKDFKELAVDVRTESNMYNFIAPFKKTNCFWRVGYIDPKKGDRVYHWSEVRTFTIAGDAVPWDRSMLADEKYLKSKGHPRMLFNATNREAFSRHVQENEKEIWRTIKIFADRAIASDWWKNGEVEHKSGTGKLGDLANVAFVWQMTRDRKYLEDLNPKPQELLVKAARSYIETGAAFVDMVSGGRQGVDELALAYDWLYEVMTPEQRKEVAAQIGSHSRWVVLTAAFQAPRDRASAGDDPVKGVYSEDRVRGCLTTSGESHTADNFVYSMVGAFAACTEDEWAKRLFDLGVNNYFGRPLWNGTEEGGSGGGYMTLYTYMTLQRAMLCQIAFPEAKFNIHPWFRGIVDWWSRIRAVGTEAEIFPWGVAGTGVGSHWGSFGRTLALFSGDGRAMKHWREQMQWFPEKEAFRIGRWYKAASTFYFKEPPEEEVKPLARVFPLGGWVMGACYPPNTPQAFRDGIGFVFACRPQATGRACAFDLSFQLWAYGQSITENGCASWSFSERPQCRYTLMVDGMGPSPRGDLPYGGRIFAFRHAPEYTYGAGEGHRLYSGEVAKTVGVKKVNRHFLMVRDRFFIIFDDLETERPAKFSWIYHLLEEEVGLDPSAPGTFRYVKNFTSNVPAKQMSERVHPTYKYQRAPVTVFVSHVAHPGELELKDQTGEERTTNPITGKAFAEKLPVEGSMGDARKHALWISNRKPEKKFHFLSVIYPVRPGSPDAPQVKRLDDFTVEVVNGREKDVVSFDPQTKHPATLIVDLAALEPPPVKE